MNRTQRTEARRRKRLKIAAIAAVALVFCAQAMYSLSKRSGTAVSESREVEGAPRRPGPAPAEIAAFSLETGARGEVVTLRRGDGRWMVESLFAIPADAAKIDRFLASLLESAREEVAAAGDHPNTGLRGGGGIRVRLWDDQGRELPGFDIGLRPESDFRAVYARQAGDERIFLLHADVRGDMGIWRNAHGAAPDAGFWMETVVLSFDPDAVEEFRAVYPDHRTEFILGDDGWVLSGLAPGGSWMPEALEAWLTDLSTFQVLDAADPAALDLSLFERAPFRLEIVLDDGTVKRVAAVPERTANGMWVETSDHPGRPYLMPYWRFQLYFLRFEGLFPDAVFAYPPERVRVIDIRRDGEGVKISKRGDEWRAVALPYVPRRDRVERLVRLASSWRARDYAENDGRSVSRGPVLEITLDDGEVFQYRLGGRHSVFPWRYVTVNGRTTLSADASEAAVMFPDFSDVLDLGRVFSEVNPSLIEAVELSTVAGDVMFTLRRVHGPSVFWEAETPDGVAALDPEDVDALVAAPLAWTVKGMPGRDADEGGDGLFLLRAAGGGADQTVTLFAPRGKDVLFVSGHGRPLVLNRSDFSVWLSRAEEFGRRIVEESAAEK